MRRGLRWGLVLAGLAAVVAAGAIVLWPEPPDRVTRENFDRIREGFSLAEATAILGPPGDYSTVETDVSQASPYGSESISWCNWGRAHTEVEVWSGDCAELLLFLDESDHVVAAQFTPARKVEQGAVDLLLWRLKRQWRRWFPEK